MSATYAETKARIVCPGCKQTRTVSARQRRRIEQGIHNTRCYWCRNNLTTSKPITDTHLRYWLRQHGAVIPNHINPRAWVIEHGLPPTLQQLANDFVEDLGYMFDAT